MKFSRIEQKIRWTFRKKALIGFGLALCLLVGVIVFSLINMVRLGNAAGAILKENYQSILAADNMIGSLERQDSAILLDTVGDQRDRYGRLLAYVRLPDGTSLNEELIRQGFGYAYLPYRHSRYDDYNLLMTQAIRGKKGLWNNVTRDQLPKWLREKRPEMLRFPSADGPAAQ